MTKPLAERGKGGAPTLAFAARRPAGPPKARGPMVGTIQAAAEPAPAATSGAPSLAPPSLPAAEDSVADTINVMPLASLYVRQSL